MPHFAQELKIGQTSCLPPSGVLAQSVRRLRRRGAAKNRVEADHIRFLGKHRIKNISMQSPGTPDLKTPKVATSISEMDTEMAGQSFDTPTPSPQEVQGMGKRQLMDSFQSILDANAIYYPVAYRFHRRLGTGRQGIVYLAERQGARGCFTRHAVKIFDPGIYSSVKKYWTDMGRIAAQISRLHAYSSPNLVDCDFYEETNGIGYIQMQCIDGMDLRRFLDAGHLEIAKRNCTPEEWSRFMTIIFTFHDGAMCIQPGVAVYIMRQMLAGLETLHNARYLHCDIKPGNTMIDPLGYVKVIDFGRANLVNERMSILLGSPLYMAPEIHDRQPPSFQSDLYGVGLVGLELLRGKRLSEDETIGEPELQRLKSNLPAQLPKLLPPYVHRNEILLGFFRRLLHPNPAKRYPDAVSAESDLAVVHKQLTQLDIDSDYRRDLVSYFAKYMKGNPTCPPGLSNRTA